MSFVFYSSTRGNNKCGMYVCAERVRALLLESAYWVIVMAKKVNLLYKYSSIKLVLSSFVCTHMSSSRCVSYGVMAIAARHRSVPEPASSIYMPVETKPWCGRDENSMAPRPVWWIGNGAARTAPAAAHNTKLHTSVCCV